MPTMYNGSSLADDILLTKQLGTLLTLSTKQKYVDKNVQFTINVQSGIDSANTATADADIESTDDINVGGVNISDVIGTKTTTEPSSGYYIRVKASGSGSSKVTTAGWLDEGTMDTASTTAVKYFPIQAATVSTTGINTVSPSASITGSNVFLSNTNNGISVTAIGGGTATASTSVASSQAGYLPVGETPSSSIVAPSITTSAATFISGVTLEAPASGTNTFSITVPNGESTLTIYFSVDANGDVTIS